MGTALNLLLIRLTLMKPSTLLLIVFSGLSVSASAQLSLTGISYTQTWDSLDQGLPAGWSVHRSTTLSSNGTTAIFTDAETAWNVTTLGSDFRNIASDTIASSSLSAAQNASGDRAFGWRPVGTSSGEVSPGRNGALMLTVANTTNYTINSLSIDLFTANNVTGTQTYQLEFRVGGSGNYTAIGSAYSTTTPFGSSTITADLTTLAALSNQSGNVTIRLRGTAGSGSTNLDTLGVSSFSMTYSTVPEPSTYAAIFGGVAMLGVAIQRRRAKAVLSKTT